MANNSFFVAYEFNKRVSGFSCSCKGEKIYSLESYESIDSMIDDVCKLLKEQDAAVTFQSFTGFESIDLLRLLHEYDHSLSMVTWKYNKYGYASENIKEQGNKMNRNNVKKYVLKAIELFKEKEAA